MSLIITYLLLMIFLPYIYTIRTISVIFLVIFSQSLWFKHHCGQSATWCWLITNNKQIHLISQTIQPQFTLRGISIYIGCCSLCSFNINISYMRNSFSPFWFVVAYKKKRRFLFLILILQWWCCWQLIHKIHCQVLIGITVSYKNLYIIVYYTYHNTNK